MSYFLVNNLLPYIYTAACCYYNIINMTVSAMPNEDTLRALESGMFLPITQVVAM